MEPLAKRPRLGPSPQERLDSDDEDELSFLPDEIIKKRDPGERLQESRANAANRLKSTFEHIFKKYEKDFSDVGDEIDLRTGQVVLDNGHLRDMRHEKDIGMENEEEDEGMLLSEMIDEDDESEEEGDDENLDDGNDDEEGRETQGLVLPVEEGEAEAEGGNVRRIVRGRPKQAQASNFNVPRLLGSSTARRAPVRTQELPTPARLAAEHRLSSLASVRKSPLSQPPMSSAGVWGSDNDSLDPAWRTPILPQTSSPDTPSSRRQRGMYQMPAVDGSNSLWASTSDAGISQWPARPPRPVLGSSPSIRRRIDFSTIAKPGNPELLTSSHKDYDEDEILMGTPEAGSSPLRREPMQQDKGDANAESGPSVDEVPTVTKRQRKSGKAGQLNGAEEHQTARSPTEKSKDTARGRKPGNRDSATSGHGESAEATSSQRRPRAQIRRSRLATAEAPKSTGVKRTQLRLIAPSRPPSEHASDEARQLEEMTEKSTETPARPHPTFQDFVVELRQRRTTPGPLTTVEESPPQLSRLVSDAQSLPTPPLDQPNLDDFATGGGGQEEGQSTMASGATGRSQPDHQVESADNEGFGAVVTLTETAPSPGERFSRHELPPELDFSDEDEGFLKVAAVNTFSRNEKEGMRIPSRGDPIHPTAVATPAKKQPQLEEEIESDAHDESGLVEPSSRDSVVEMPGEAAESVPGKEDATLPGPRIHEPEEAERPSMAGKPRRRKTLQLHREAEPDHQPRPWLAGPPRRRRTSQPAPEASLQAEPDPDFDMLLPDGGEEVEEMALDPPSPDQDPQAGSGAARASTILTENSGEAVSSSRPSRWRESSSPPGGWPAFSSRMATIESLDDSLEAELDDIMAEQEIFEEQQRAAAASEAPAEERTESSGANFSSARRETNMKKHNLEGPAAVRTMTPPEQPPPGMGRRRQGDERSSSRTKLSKTVQFKDVGTESDGAPKPTAQEEGSGQAETIPRPSSRRTSGNKANQEVFAPKRAEATAGQSSIIKRGSQDSPQLKKRGRPPRATKHEDKTFPVQAKPASTRRQATRPTARRSLPSVLLAAQDDSDDDDPLNAMSLLTSWTKQDAAAGSSPTHPPPVPVVSTPKSSRKHRWSSSGLRSGAPPHSSSAGPGSLRKRLARDGFGGMRTPTKRRRTAGLGDEENEENVAGGGASRGDRDRAMWSPTGSVILTPGGHARRCGVDGFTCNRDFCFTCLAG